MVNIIIIASMIVICLIPFIVAFTASEADKRYKGFDLTQRNHEELIRTIRDVNPQKDYDVW